MWLKYENVEYYWNYWTFYIINDLFKYKTNDVYILYINIIVMSHHTLNVLKNM